MAEEYSTPDKEGKGEARVDKNLEREQTRALKKELREVEAEDKRIKKQAETILKEQKEQAIKEQADAGRKEAIVGQKKEEEKEELQRLGTSFWDGRTQITPKTIFEVVGNPQEKINPQNYASGEEQGYRLNDMNNQSIQIYKEIIGRGMQTNHKMYGAVMQAIENQMEDILKEGLTIYLYVYVSNNGQNVHGGTIKIRKTPLSQLQGAEETLLGQEFNKAKTLLEELGINGQLIETSPIGNHGSKKITAIIANWEYG